MQYSGLVRWEIKYSLTDGDDAKLPYMAMDRSPWNKLSACKVETFLFTYILPRGQ